MVQEAVPNKDKQDGNSYVSGASDKKKINEVYFKLLKDMKYAVK